MRDPRAERARRSPKGEDGLPRKSALTPPKAHEFGPNRRLRRRPWPPVSHRNSTANGSDRHPGSAPSRTAARPRWRACRRSGTPCPACRLLADQPAFNQPKRIGKPSPPSRVTDS